jgi:hypothetical protein
VQRALGELAGAAKDGLLHDCCRYGPFSVLRTSFEPRTGGNPATRVVDQASPEMPRLPADQEVAFVLHDDQPVGPEGVQVKFADWRVIRTTDVTLSGRSEWGARAQRLVRVCIGRPEGPNAGLNVMALVRRCTAPTASGDSDVLRDGVTRRLLGLTAGAQNVQDDLARFTVRHARELDERLGQTRERARMLVSKEVGEHAEGDGGADRPRHACRRPASATASASPPFQRVGRSPGFRARPNSCWCVSVHDELTLGMCREARSITRPQALLAR